MDPVIRSIIASGLLAPSGENAQPWRFRVAGDTIYLLDDPLSDRSLYNIDSRGTMAAQGAALENMIIATHAQGRKVDISLFPHEGATASLTIGSPVPTTDVELSRCITDRNTNRNPFRSAPLRGEIGKMIEDAARPFAEHGIELIRVEGREQVAALAVVASTNERIMLGNRELHGFFFSHLTWTEDEDNRMRKGFYIKTLELPLPVQIMFRLLKFWPVMRVLKSVGFPALVGKGNSLTYAAAGEFGIITVNDNSRVAIVHAGRLLERIWLTLAQNGVALQPCTGTLFLAYAAEHVTPDRFSAYERLLLSDQAAVVAAMTRGRRPVLMYRAGYSKRPPSARSKRFELESVLI